jgi:Zn-dependent peptidase ImmA (M78 family)
MGYSQNLIEEIDNMGIDIWVTESIPTKLKGFYYKTGQNSLILMHNSVQLEVETNCILAEELGHYHTTTGNIVDLKNLHNQKQEKKAHKWAHNRLIPLERFIACYYNGCHNRFETAEFLGVTEEFLAEALQCYKEKYGECAVVEDHIIYFDPLGVMRVF